MSQFVVYGVINAVVVFAVWRMTRPRRLCGPECKHPDAKLGTTRYVICEQCPIKDLCQPGDPCEYGST